MDVRKYSDYFLHNSFLHSKAVVLKLCSEKTAGSTGYLQEFPKHNAFIIKSVEIIFMIVYFVFYFLPHLRASAAFTLSVKKGKGKGHPCTSTEALCRPYGP
jgi:hypothetical protein